MAKTSTALLSLFAWILAAGARAQTPSAPQAPHAATAAAPSATAAAPPEIVETPYDIVEIAPIVGSSGAKATQLKYNSQHYDDAQAIKSEAAELMARVLPAAEADHNKFASINAVKPEAPKGIKTIFERKPSGEWTPKGAPETPKLAEQFTAVYAKLDAAAKAKDSAAIAALEAPGFGHYLSNGTARTTEGDAQTAALTMKAVATYRTKVVGFFVHDDQVSVVQEREWTGDFLPNQMGAVRKVKETSRSADLWKLTGGQLQLLRSKELDQAMVKL